MPRSVRPGSGGNTGVPPVSDDPAVGSRASSPVSSTITREMSRTIAAADACSRPAHAVIMPQEGDGMRSVKAGRKAELLAETTNSPPPFCVMLPLRKQLRQAPACAGSTSCRARLDVARDARSRDRSRSHRRANSIVQVVALHGSGLNWMVRSPAPDNAGAEPSLARIARPRPDRP